MNYKINTVLLLLLCFCSFAQTPIDSIQQLDVVILSDSKLKNYASGLKLTTLNDSILKQNTKSLTGLLAFNSNLYFKENGFGMVSSPSFRGTNASQTAVIWNGININSQLNGQTDFNTINTSNYNSITIRSGGGSVQYGSGAVGGSIHLNNTLAFQSHFKNAIETSYGSFNTKQIAFNSSFGKKTLSANFSVSFIDSQNNYKYLGTDKVNENGQYSNFNINLSLGYFITKNDILKLFHNSYNGDRELSGSLVAPSNSEYKDENYRTLLEWTRSIGKLNSKLRVAHLKEQFRYFQNKDKDDYTFGNVTTWKANYNLNYRFSEAIKAKTIVDYSYYEALGSSFGMPNRKQFSITALLSHKLNSKLNYRASLRKDETSTFKSPILGSLTLEYVPFSFYKIYVNGSKNFRVPTFNDLYWQPGGNLNLVPETSYQIDLGHEFNYKFANLKLNVFYITTEDLIQWKPNNTGVWSPVNVTETENYGLETELRLQQNYNNHHFELAAHYSYTISEDKTTKKQLIYVPFHKGNINLAYHYHRFSVFYQHLYTGAVFITQDNLIGRLFSLNAYDIANVGCQFKVLNTEKNTLALGLRVNNIYNEIYNNVASRPMPNRNFNIQLHYKF